MLDFEKNTKNVSHQYFDSSNFSVYSFKLYVPRSSILCWSSLVGMEDF